MANNNVSGNRLPVILQTPETREQFNANFTKLNPVCSWYEQGTRRSVRASDVFRRTLPEDIENDNQTLKALEEVSSVWYRFIQPLIFDFHSHSPRLFQTALSRSPYIFSCIWPAHTQRFITTKRCFTAATPPIQFRLTEQFTATIYCI